MTVIDEKLGMFTQEESVNLTDKAEILEYLNNVIDSFIHIDRIKESITEDSGKSKVISFMDIHIKKNTKHNVHSTKPYTKCYGDIREFELLLGYEYITSCIDWNELLTHIRTSVNNIDIKDYRINIDTSYGFGSKIIKIYLVRTKT